MPETAVAAPAAAEAPPVPPAAAETPPEKPAEAKVEPPKPKPGDFAAKARAERERVQAAQAGKALQAERDALRAERDSLKAEQEKAAQRRQEYLKNPVQALMDSFPGLEPVKAFEMIAEAAKTGKTPPSAETFALQQRIDAIEKQRLADLEGQKKAQAAAAEAAGKQAEADFRKEIGAFLKENADAYELTALQGDGEDAIFQVIDAHYAKTLAETGEGEIMSKKVAADLIEAKLEELTDKALKTKKFSARFRPAADEGPPKTLTNELSAKVTKEDRGMSERERMARAAAAMDRLGGLK